VKELIHREGFDPKTLYADTWPAGKDAIEALMPDVKGRLGIFHWMKRISDTLRPVRHKTRFMSQSYDIPHT
jgi:hypothetical protein